MASPDGVAWVIAAVLILVTVALYEPAIPFGFVNYDDTDYVTSNPRVQAGLSFANVGWAFTTGTAANWHPLTWLSLMLDVTVFGNSAPGMHFTNVAMHALNAVLIFYLLLSLTGARWRSALVAALFAWHPLHVESVAWVSERKDVLSTFFGLLSLLGYERYASASLWGNLETSQNKPAEPQKRKFISAMPAGLFYWLALGFLALGLMSKSMLVTWPFVMLLLDFWPLNRWKAGCVWSLIKEKLPFFTLVVVASAVTFRVQKQAGAMVLKNLPFGERFDNALISYVRYLEKIVWPVDLAVFYPHPAHWALLAVFLAGMFLALVSVWAWRRRRNCPFFLMGWLWFGGTLVPVIGLVQVGVQAMADRYSYIPSIGLFVAIIWGLGSAVEGRVAPPLLAAVSSVVLVLCLAVTRHQIEYWRTSESLFRHALAVTDDNFIAHYNLGFALDVAGKTEESIAQYREAVRLRPDVADFHSNLGYELGKNGQADESIQECEKALSLQPDDAQTHRNLGLAFIMKGQTNAAISQLKEAVRLKPDLSAAHYDLGVIQSDLGQNADAITQFNITVTLNQTNADAHYNLGNALAHQGQADAAVAQFQETLRLRPADAAAHNNLGNLLARQGQTEAAITELEAAASLKPADAAAHYNLGNLLLRTGRWPEAISQFQESLRGKPAYAPAHYNLGVALSKSGRPDAAMAQYAEAIRLQPDYAIAHNSLGIALADAGRLDEAISQFREALRINPAYAAASQNLTNALALKHR